MQFMYCILFRIFSLTKRVLNIICTKYVLIIPKFSCLAWTSSCTCMPTSAIDIFILYIIDISDFTYLKWDFWSFPPLPLFYSQPSSPQTMTTSSFQLLRPEAWELPFDFSLCLTLNLSGFRTHTESDHLLPPCSTTQVWGAYISCLDLLKESLSDLSARSLLPCNLFCT